MIGTTVADIVRAVSDATGAPASLVSTGGGCGAVEVRLEGGGAFVLVTDEDVLDAYAGEGQAFSGGAFVGLYSSDEDDSPCYLDRDEDTTPDQIADMLRRVLAGEGQR